MKNTKKVIAAIILICISIGVLFGLQIYFNSQFVTDGKDDSHQIAIVNISPENITVRNVGTQNVTLESFYINKVLDSGAVFSRTILAPSENAIIIPSTKLDMQYGLELEVQIKEKNRFATRLHPSLQIVNFSAESVTVKNIGYLNLTLTNFYVNRILDAGAVFSKTELAPSESATIIPSSKFDWNKWVRVGIETLEGGITEAVHVTPIASP
jgi:hypothetical protein